MYLKIVFSSINLISVFVLALGVSGIIRKKEHYAVFLRRLMMAAACAVLANVGIAAAIEADIAAFSYLLYFVALDWVIYFITAFCIEYTGHGGVARKLRIPLLVLMTLDSLCLGLNPWLGHSFCVYSVTDDKGEVFFLTESYIPYEMHLYLDYLVLVIGIGFLISKIFRSHSYYRYKYSIILGNILLVVVLNIIYMAFSMYLDWSVVFYALAGMMLYVSTFVFIPATLTNRSMFFAVDGMKEGLIIFDLDEECIYLNQFVKDNFGARKENLTLKSPLILDFLGEDTSACGSFGKSEHVALDEQGNPKDRFRIRYECLRSKKGHCLGSYFLIENITEEYNTMVALELARQAANKASQSKSLFLASMSHEIRTPINAVLGMNEMILRECQNEQIAEYAHNIALSGGALLGLINDILDFSKIEAGKMEIDELEYDTHELLRSCFLMHHSLAEEKGLYLHFECDENIPSRLRGDVNKIRQIIVNITSNAIKYTKKGGIDVIAGFEPGDVADEIRFVVKVKDTGIGISEENQKILFDSFQRVDIAHNRNIEGTGLGLAITKNLARLMGGDVYVESVLGEGSTFILCVPQQVKDSAPAGQFIMKKTAPKTEYKESFRAPGAHILVVDDVAMNLKVVEALLKKTMVKIDTAGGGMEAFELCRENTYDLIFMDHMMPEPDGIETFGMIRREGLNRETPVIVLTANAIGGVEKEYEDVGFDGYLSKPVKGMDLERVLLSYLNPELLEQ